MVGPSKQFDKQETLEKAMKVFWERGYEATSIQDLVSGMGINRASLYQTYGNKHDLYMACLIRYIDNSVQQLEQLLDLPGSAMGNLQKTFKSFIEHSLVSDSQGCFINNTAVELGPHDQQLAGILRDSWQQFESIFLRLVQRAKKNNELGPDSNEEQLARLLNTSLQGLMVKTKANTAKEQLFEVVDTLFDLIRK